MAKPASDKLAELGAWAAESSKQLAIVGNRLEADAEMIARALEIVREFIVARRLVVFGGLAIDCALRLRGSSIYPEGERPDYDFLSPRSVDDAYDLADLLCREGFPDVSAIRAIHVQTMRVRVNFVGVADLGYVPPAVFARLPTLDFRGMRIIHPLFQRMDLHLGFTYPLGDPPRENIFNRWPKDQKRLALFDEHWPVACEAAAPPATRTVRAFFGGTLLGGEAALTGFAGYAVMRARLDELAAAARRPVRCRAPRLKFALVGPATVEMEVPDEAGCRVAAASHAPEALLMGLPDITRHEPYLDVMELTTAGENVEVVNTKNRLLAATLAKTAAGDVFVATPHHVMLYFLCKHFVSSSAAAPSGSGAAPSVYLDYYRHCQEVVAEAHEIFADRLARAAGADDARKVMDLYAASPFAATVTTVGTANVNPAYCIILAEAVKAVKGDPPTHVPGLLEFIKQLEGLPTNYFPGGKKTRPVFDYDQCALFRRSGAALDASAPVSMATRAR